MDKCSERRGHVAAPLALTAESCNDAQVRRGAQKEILLVEDQDVVRALVRRVLEEEGYVVHEAHDGNHALEVAASVDGEIDLLLTDLVMPNLGGQIGRASCRERVCCKV